MIRIFVLFLVLKLIPSLLLYSGNQSFEEDSIRARSIYYKARSLAKKNLFGEAIDSFKLSLSIRKKTFGENHFYVGSTLSAIGINYKNLGRFDQAIEYYEKAEKVYLSQGDKYMNYVSNVYNNIGNVYESKLNYSTAMEYYNRAVDIKMQEDEVDLYYVADIKYNIADIYQKMGEYEKAIEIIDNNHEHAFADTKLSFLDLKSVIYYKLNMPKTADEYYLKAIEYAHYLTKHDILHEIDVAFEYLNYASFLISVDQMEKALETLEKAHSIITLTQQNEGTDLAQYYSVMGDYYRSMKVESKELHAFKKQKNEYLSNAIKSYKNGLDALNFEFSISPDTIQSAESSLSLVQSLTFLKTIADVYIQLADIYDIAEESNYITNLNIALDYYDVTSHLIQQARKEISSDESKIQLAELEQSTFHKMIQAAYKAFEVNPNQEILNFAFENAERIKASSVFDRLSDEFAKNELIPDSLIEKERMLNSYITTYQENLRYLEDDEEAVAEEIEKTTAKIFELKKQREELNQYLETNYPNYYELKYSDNLLGVSNIQKKLKNNEVLIEYVLNENDSITELYAFLITKDELQFIQPKIDGTFIQAVQSTFQFMSNPRYMFTKNEDSKLFCVSSYLLYQKLIMPFENQIRDKKILIIPDGKLNYVAFDALIEELPDTSSSINFADLKYLIRKNTINYSYSANLLYGFKESKASVNNDVLAFAPDYSSTDTIEFNNTRMALMPLPGIIEEVDIISREIKKTKKFVEDEATEINFREHSEEFDILHLAMHAFIDDNNPAFSRLAFTQNGDRNETNENNGWLNTADIYNLDLNARLTVLSACNTGSGTLRKGEGVMSLARGFLYAGCPSIVMTLWEVDDRAGTEIMGSFYRKLKKGRSIDESLRMAKLDYLENANPRTAHPHFWLGYVSIGDSSPIFRSYDYYFFGLLIVALIAVTIDQLVRAGKSRKKRTE